MSSKEKIKIFTGSAHPGLAKEVCDAIGVPLSNAEVGRFPDGEVTVKFNEDVRGADVFIIQPTCTPPNDNLMELLIMTDCAIRSSAERVTAVIPYFGYARQDRKAEGRVPITAKLVANLITHSGADRILTMDLHASQIQGFFDIPLDHIFASPVMVSHLQELGLKDPVAVSVDVGGAKMVRAYAKRMNAELAIIDKRRSGPHEIEVMKIIGEVEGKTAVIIDDMISTGSSMAEACIALRKHGARDVLVCATHAVFAGKCIEKMESAKPKSVVVTNTIPLGPEKQRPFIKQLSVAKLFGEAIKRIHRSESISSLFLD